MRKYRNQQEKALEMIVCNACGKEIKPEKDIIREGVCSIECVWGYFSKKDGIRHNFDLCEECYDMITAAFHIPLEECTEQELL
jgi:hypothetical protein